MMIGRNDDRNDDMNENTKHQAPNTREAPSPKLQGSVPAAGFGIWCLGFLWSLVFGIWDLSSRKS
jgi:hypothetical protein